MCLVVNQVNSTKDSKSTKNPCRGKAADTLIVLLGGYQVELASVVSAGLLFFLRTRTVLVIARRAIHHSEYQEYQAADQGKEVD